MKNKILGAFLSFISGLISNLYLSGVSFWLASLQCPNSDLSISSIFHTFLALRVFSICFLNRLTFNPLYRLFRRFSTQNFQQRILGSILMFIGCFITIIMAHINPITQRFMFILVFIVASFFLANANLVFLRYNLAINPKTQDIHSMNTKFYSFGGFLITIFVLLNDISVLLWDKIFIYTSVFIMISILIFIFISSDEIYHEEIDTNEAFDEFKTRNRFLLIQQLLFLILFNLQHRFAYPLIKPYLRHGANLTRLQFFFNQFIGQIFVGVSIDKCSKVINNCNLKTAFIRAIIFNIFTSILYFLYSLDILLIKIIVTILCISGAVFLYNLPKWILLSLPITIIAPLQYQAFISSIMIVFIEKIMNGMRLILFYTYKIHLCNKNLISTQLPVVEGLELFLSSILQIYSGYIFQHAFYDEWIVFFGFNIILSMVPLIFFINSKTKFYNDLILANKKNN